MGAIRGFQRLRKHCVGISEAFARMLFTIRPNGWNSPEGLLWFVRTAALWLLALACCKHSPEWAQISPECSSNALHYHFKSTLKVSEGLGIMQGLWIWLEMLGNASKCSSHLRFKCRNLVRNENTLKTPRKYLKTLKCTWRQDRSEIMRKVCKEPI
jgi:hypothetical protein